MERERAKLDHLTDREKEQHIADLEARDRENAARNAAALAAGESDQSISSSSEMERAELRRKEEEARGEMKLQGIMRRLAATMRDAENNCRWCSKPCELIDGLWHHALPLEACAGPPVKLTSTGRVAPVSSTPSLAIVKDGDDLSSETYKQRLAAQRAGEIEQIRTARPRKIGSDND